MTLPIPLVPLPGTATGRDLPGHPKPPALLLLALSSPPGPAPHPRPAATPSPPRRTTPPPCGSATPPPAWASWPRPPPRSASPPSTAWSTPPATSRPSPPLEAAIPDTAALVFASLGIALALHGRRALRARALNLASVAASVLMNALAAAPGWREPGHLDPAPRRLRPGQRHPDRRRPRPGSPAPHLVTALAARHPLPPSAACSCGCCAWPWPPPPPWPGSAPGSSRSARSPPAAAPPRTGRGSGPVPRKATKTARFLDLVTERHGPLAHLPLHQVAAISADLAPHADLNPGSARAALRKAVLAARTGDPR